MKNTLHIPPQMWQNIRSLMLQVGANNQEAIAFIFCQKQQLNNEVRYLPKHWIIPDTDCYEYQSESGLVMKQHFHHYLLEKYLQNEELDVVHLHTHIGNNAPDFSPVDDRYESEYARFLTEQFSQQPQLISGVFSQNLEQYQFRIWNAQGTDFKPVDLSTSWLKIEQNSASYLPSNSLMFARQKVFGDLVQQQLGNLKVALIGCGGIGSVFAETLGRLGVQKWLLIDPDHLELVNLNRLVAATLPMVEQQWSKVDYVKYLLQRIEPQKTTIVTRCSGIENQLIAPEVGSCDLIVVATDNHRSRQIAQEIALKYQRPLVNLGTHIEVKSDGIPRIYARITIPPLGGGWCLMCGNIINLQRAALEIAPSPINQLASGYLEDVPAPSVLWLNSICASTAVGIIQGIMAGFVNVDAGLDWIYQFPSQEWLKTNPQHLHNDDCLFCASALPSEKGSSVNEIEFDHSPEPDFYYV
jgi:molybdopterin-synthase adenylyltransferase